jgi:hypothetical protein
MSIFKRSAGDGQQTSAAVATEPPEVARPEQPATAMPPFVAASAAPGVVPPPAAPIYSMRPPEAASQGGEGADGSLAEKVSAAKDQQQRVKEKVRVAVQRARSSVSAASPSRSMTRPAQRPAPQPAPVIARMSRPRGSSDPSSYAQFGLLNLAWRWQEAGAPIRAIHAYMELLTRYPDTPAASAAVADLVALSEKLAEEGRFHIALAIYDQLEVLL